MKLYQRMAALVQARENCLRDHNAEWFDRHTKILELVAARRLPRGSGFDNGTTVDFDQSKPNKLVLQTVFHHMNDAGMYDGWNDYTVTVMPDLAFGFTLRVNGVNRNDIKDYIHNVFTEVLSEDISTEENTKFYYDLGKAGAS